MEKEHEVAAKYLREHSFKLTKQRRKIIEAIFATHEHFTADELHDLLRDRGESISKATVYRTLGLLAECGFIEARDFGRGQQYFEHVLGHEHHDHLICTKCGKVLEFRNQEMEKLKERIAKARGFHMEKHSLRIFGTCRDCANS